MASQVLYLRDTSHDADCSEDEEDDEDVSPLMNSVDGNVDKLSGREQPNPYSVTPPVNKRFMKRAKVKQHSNQKKNLSYKDYKEYLEKKKLQPKTAVNVIKEKYPAGQGLLSLGHVDSDDSMEKEARRELKERKRKDGKDIRKTFKTSRGIERDEKLYPKDLITLVPDAQDTQLKGTRTRKIFNSTPLVMPNNNLLNPLLDERLLRRGAFDSSEICPRDRIEFYRIFSMLINMGSHGKKEKDGKDQMVPGINRQLSFEQEFWQTQFTDLLWIELQAYLNDCPAQEQFDTISQERERVPGVLNSVLNFKIDCKGFNIGARCDGDDAEDCFQNNSGLERSSPSLSTPYENYITPEMLQKQREAISQVQDLLEELDKCEKLFPTSKAFEKAYELYASELFVQRVKCLYLWLNITLDLCHKMKVLEKILGVQNIEGLNWPIIECGSHRNSLNFENNVFIELPNSPNVQTGSEDEDSNSSRVEKEGGSDKNLMSLTDSQSKKVHFLVASESEKSSRAASPMTVQPLPNASSTPLKASAQLASVSQRNDIYRNLSDPNFEDYNKTSMYRYFVDKSLKKMGMNKLILRLRDLLDRTLQRAREVLEKPRSTTLHLNVGEKVMHDIIRM